MNILELTKDWDEPQIAELLKLINLRRDKVTRVWDYVFGKQPTLYERDRTTKMIDDYGYDKVKQAFGIAGDNGISQNKCLSYIQKVLDNLKQEESIKKEKAFQALKLKEVSIITNEPIREKTDMTAWKGFSKRALENNEK